MNLSERLVKRQLRMRERCRKFLERGPRYSDYKMPDRDLDALKRKWLWILENADVRQV